MTPLEILLQGAPSQAAADAPASGWQARPPPGLFDLTTRPPVPYSPDVERVVALPRRPQIALDDESPKARALVEYMNSRLRRPDWRRTDCRCASFGRKCITSLQPVQAWALHEAPIAGGLIMLAATGSGKTAIGFLMPMVMPGCKLAIGLVPANLIDQLAREFALWSEHWYVPRLVYGPQKSVLGDPRVWRPTLHVISYNQLSMPASTNLLKEKLPDLLYADEMDKLADLSSARTMRFNRQFVELPDTKFCGWTGTPWDKSIMECTHLAAFALRWGSPLPLEPQTSRIWALALDPTDSPAGAGALRQLCNSADETLHEGFHRRLVETLGVVATTEGAIDIPLNFYERHVARIPPVIESMLDQVRAFERPDGEELVDALEVARVVVQVAQGFYYRWRFPKLPRDERGELTAASKTLIYRWLACRKAWRKELRKKLQDGQAYLDSEKLCTLAAIRYYAGQAYCNAERSQIEDRLRAYFASENRAARTQGVEEPYDESEGVAAYAGDLPTWGAESWLAWAEVKDLVEYETEAVWVDDYLVRDAVAWAHEHRGIVWYKHTTFGQAVAKMGNFPLYGDNCDERIAAERGHTSIVCSITAHGRGRDGLQYHFHEQLNVVPPSSGRMHEQFLARLHRVGQPQPEVNTWGYRTLVPEFEAAFDQAIARAEFAQSTWGASQKLLTGVWRDG